MKKNNMKSAVVDQMLLWIILITVFASFLFFIINYSVALRIKDNVDSLTDYGARMVALGRSDAEVVAGLNNIKLSSMADIQEADLNCVENADSNYQVEFNVLATYDSTFFEAGANNVQGRAVVFNEVSDLEKVCSLTLSF